jgi:hypothetical protein
MKRVIYDVARQALDSNLTQQCFQVTAEETNVDESVSNVRIHNHHHHQHLHPTNIAITSHIKIVSTLTWEERAHFSSECHYSVVCRSRAEIYVRKQLRFSKSSAYQNASCRSTRTFHSFNPILTNFSVLLVVLLILSMML